MKIDSWLMLNSNLTHSRSSTLIRVQEMRALISICLHDAEVAEESRSLVVQSELLKEGWQTEAAYQIPRNKTCSLFTPERCFLLNFRSRNQRSRSNCRSLYKCKRLNIWNFLLDSYRFWYRGYSYRLKVPFWIFWIPADVVKCQGKCTDL